MAKTFFITTAIDYTNSAPHIGHAYEKILADVIARYHRLNVSPDGKRQPVFFMTGVDQHGQKVQQSAEKQGVPPGEFVAGVTQQFIALWDKLDVRYDAWASTTDPLHKHCVQGMLQRLYDQGKIYKDKQVGFYSVRQEQFLTDKDRNAAGEFGPEWGEVEQREEENYYFKLEEHKQWLLEFIKKRSKQGNPFVVPDFRVAELLNAVEKLSGDRQSGSDLCISRPKSRLSWGIELPFDPDYVNYVWFDALSNYISFAGYDPAKKFDDQPAEFRGRWPALHVIGKDILVPAHGIYWPIMLHALGFPDEQMPTLLVHGWWNVSGAKMSKSLGNVVDPDALIDKYGAEALRYYLMSEIVPGKDADFSEDRLSDRYRADLANSLGNLLNRSLNMIWKFNDGVLRSGDENSVFEEKREGKNDYASLPEFRQNFLGYCVLGYRIKMETGGLHLVMYELFHTARSANFLIDIASPWKLAKSQGDQARARLDAVLYHVAESLRIIAILISPVLPNAAHKIFDQLNWKMELSGKEARFSLADVEWGKLPDGHVVGKPVPLFPRIEG
jgi:methionyl-tRNA synthetase